MSKLSDYLYYEFSKGKKIFNFSFYATNNGATKLSRLLFLKRIEYTLGAETRSIFNIRIKNVDTFEKAKIVYTLIVKTVHSSFSRNLEFDITERIFNE